MAVGFSGHYFSRTSKIAILSSFALSTVVIVLEAFVAHFFLLFTQQIRIFIYLLIFCISVIFSLVLHLDAVDLF